MSLLETDLLAELIGKKHQLLMQLRDLGRLQIQFIDGNDYDQLMRVLSAKQRLLGGLQIVEKELHPYRHQDPEARVWRSPEERARCARVVAESASIFAEVVQQEKDSEAQLASSRDQAAARLEGAHYAAQARGAYGFESPSVSMNSSSGSSWSVQG